jgi:hypothetical protein
MGGKMGPQNTHRRQILQMQEGLDGPHLYHPKTP